MVTEQERERERKRERERERENLLGPKLHKIVIILACTFCGVNFYSTTTAAVSVASGQYTD